MPGYVEVFEIQGSTFNDSSRPWRFYLNVGVDFPDMPARPRVRIEHVVPGSPQHFDLPDPVPAGFPEHLASLLDLASESVSRQLPAIRAAFADKRYWVGF